MFSLRFFTTSSMTKMMMRHIRAPDFKGSTSRGHGTCRRVRRVDNDVVMSKHQPLMGRLSGDG